MIRRRGWWDIVVDPVRGRLGGLLPRANLLVALDAPVETVPTRRTELDSDEGLEHVNRPTVFRDYLRRSAAALRSAGAQKRREVAARERLLLLLGGPPPPSLPADDR